jgi:hypothetical protein
MPTYYWNDAQPTNAMEAFVGLPNWTWWCRWRLGPRHIASGVWEAGLTFIPTVVIVPSLCGFSNRTPYLIWGLAWWGRHTIFSPSIELRCWPGKITTGTGTPPIVKGYVWFTDVSWMEGGPVPESMGNLINEGSVFPLVDMPVFSGRSVCHSALCSWHRGSWITGETRICSDSQVALKALRAVRMSPLVHKCQEALNDISTWHAVGLHWIPGHTGVRGNETADMLMRNGSVSGYVGPESALGVSQQDLRSTINHWLGNQHQRRWWNLGDSQRQARELISGPSRGARIRLTRAQCRVVTGLLTEHNTLCRHLHLMGLRQPTVQEVWYGGWVLCPHSLSVWGLGLYQARVSRLLFGAWGY